MSRDLWAPAHPNRVAGDRDVPWEGPDRWLETQNGPALHPRVQVRGVNQLRSFVSGGGEPAGPAV